MHYRLRFAAALAAGAFFGLGTTAKAKALLIAPARPGQLTAQADVVVTGKVTEIEKDTVEASPYPGAPKDQKMTYKIAVVKLDEGIIGGKGLTQFRVGFPDVPTSTTRPPLPGRRPGIGRIRPIRGPATLKLGQEGCFFLSRHHAADFYILAGNAPPLNKKDANYAKQLEEVKKIAKVLDNPVAALKTKELDDRFEAAYVTLQHHQMNRTGKPRAREPIPDEENKLILATLAELPWQAKDPKPRPGSELPPASRSTLWYMIQQDMVGFKQPIFKPRKPGDPPVDANKVWEDTTTAYLKDNMSKIKIKGYSK